MSKLLLFSLFIFIFVLGFFLAYEGAKFSKIFVKNPFRSATSTPNVYSLASPKPVSEIVPEKQDKGTYNVLLLGYGGVSHSGGGLMDSLIVAHVDINKNKVTFITVPRDLWVTGNRKINAAGLSGVNDLKPVITSVTGLPVNYFVSVDFNGFSKLIDSLGGITSNTPVSFTDPYYPIKGQENNVCGKTPEEIESLKTKYSGYNLEIQFPCRYEKISYASGPTNLDGTQALKYVRSRHGDSDFGRSARQTAVLKGIADKIISFNSVGKFDEIVNTLSSIVRTDLDAGTIKSLVELIGSPESYTYETLQLTTDNLLNSSKSTDGQFILIPKAGNLNFGEIKSSINSKI